MNCLFIVFAALLDGTGRKGSMGLKEKKIAASHCRRIVGSSQSERETTTTLCDGKIILTLLDDKNLIPLGPSGLIPTTTSATSSIQWPQQFFTTGDT